MDQSTTSGLRASTTKPRIVFYPFQNKQQNRPGPYSIDFTGPSISIQRPELEDRFSLCYSSQHPNALPRIVITQAELSDEFNPSFCSQATHNTPCIILTRAVLTDGSTPCLKNQPATYDIPGIIVTTPESMTELPVYDFEVEIGLGLDCYSDSSHDSDSGCGHGDFCMFPYETCKTPLTLCPHVAWFGFEEEKAVEHRKLVERNAILEQEVETLRRMVQMDNKQVKEPWARHGNPRKEPK